MAYPIADIAGQTAELTVLDDVARGAYQLVPFEGVDVAAARMIIQKYSDLHLGLAGASIVVLAERFGCVDVLTVDQRRFRAISSPKGQPFHLLPHDA